VTQLGELTIVSGGQTGADRAALDFAIEFGIAHGGWCPRGRLAEDGPIDLQYQLTDTPSRRYDERTKWNIRDSDATVVFSISERLTGGSALTVELARELGKPCLQIARDSDAETMDHAGRLVRFLAEHHVRRLNVAGPRASQEPEVAAFVHAVLKAALEL
jgi:hypothetical protein